MGRQLEIRGSITVTDADGTTHNVPSAINVATVFEVYTKLPDGTLTYHSKYDTLEEAIRVVQEFWDVDNTI